MEETNEDFTSTNEEEMPTDNDNSSNENDFQTKIEELETKNRQLFARAKKAEGFIQKDGKWIKLESEKKEIESNVQAPIQSNEPDYAKLAYLETKGIVHPDDQKIIQDEANRLKLPLTDILGMEHIKSKLQTNQDQRDAQVGMPKGKGNSGGNTQQDVDYWLAKGETPDNQELAEKVVEAREKQDKSVNPFDDIRV